MTRMTTHPVAEIKARLSEFLRQVEQGETVIISRNGKPVAALVRPEELEQLERMRRAGPQAGLAGIAGGWEGSDELVSILEDYDRTGRSVPDLD